ncbi:FmdB family zinc ribbon protein [Legionella oakridgensis]|uniref:FmdB family zinc ribbon protein n=1 Tax=Legionella oakridgensis TaxID=29423 RepID=UPI0003DE535C|nr:zinc ribbon domain-containing protein [Legionella oakridgensis]ETO92933.1 putative regulatory protein, FmdB family [Legionella oakridgensis RV-2-2007]
MPIYEYQCTGCHHQFDLMQKIHDEPVKQCPQCSKNTAVRLVSAAGFQLKGTGWYATDFKNKGKPEKPAEKTSSEQGTAGKSPDTATKSQGESV